MKKYYFITFMYGASEKTLQNMTIERHPLEWQKSCNKFYPGQYVLTDWKEISELEYMMTGLENET